MTGPHQSIQSDSPRDQFALRLFDRLWDQYRQRVSYVGDYEQVVAGHQGTFVNDHIAFRTLAWQHPTTGIVSLARLFETLGYQAAGVYSFPTKHLNAIHYQHAHPEFPKLFISELRTWELSREAQAIIGNSLTDHGQPPAIEQLHALATLEDGTDEGLLQTAASWIQDLPWSPPAADAVERLNQESQYAAWVLVHGYNVNHFTALINSHGVEALGNIEKTVAALQAAGVPMKDEIEGAVGSKLRQTATQAVLLDVPVADGTMEWTYAYFELAERGEIDGQRFEGFLGPQATQLFEMTKK